MGKPQFYPKVFDIDISVCMSCQICVEVCPFEAIKMDKEFELSQRERFDHLLLRKEQLSKSNGYYHNVVAYGLTTSPTFVQETHGPHRVLIQQFDGFGPLGE